jgi:hypothetical protein
MLALLAAIPSVQAQAQSSQYQRGYTTRDGTYVDPHFRTRPDSSPYNNYSTRGNVNPYTGQRGSVDPYRSYSAPRYPSYGYGGSRRR